MANKYKFANPEHTFVNDLERGMFGIHPGVHLWAEVEDFLKAGGVIEAFETPTEALTKATKEAEGALVKEKKRVREEGIVVDGILFDTDIEARVSYIEFMLKLMLDPTYTVTDWKASDGVWVTMNKTLFEKLITVWETRLTSLFSFVKLKDAELKTKVSKEDIKATPIKYEGI